MISDVYRQLASIDSAFVSKDSQITIGAATTVPILDVNPLRVYFSLSVLAGVTLVVNPVKTFVANPQFAVMVGATQLEIWIEKHKSLVQQKWFARNTGAGAVQLGIWEVFYQPSER